MVKIKFFDSIIEAELAKNLLKEFKIESVVQRKGLKYPGDMGDSYGADLFVTEKDIDKAKELLEISEK